MTEDALVHIVDDDRDLREAILDTLEDEQIPARGFAAASEAIRMLDPEWPGVIVSDIRMPGLSGLEFLGVVRKSAPDTPFILITGHGDVATAIAAMKAGAYDFLEKPTRPEFLVSVVRRALDMRRLQLENSSLRRMVATGGSLRTRLIGRSPEIKKCRRDILAIAGLDVDVLLRGDTGTGKTLAARCIHDLSPREGRAFVHVNCATLNANNFEQVLFAPDGKIAEADRGTLYLDEMEALDDALQARLFRFLEGRGRDGVDLRVLAAVKSAPQDLIEAGRLRADLYYQINVAQVALPALRDRGRDVFILLEYFIRDAAARHDLKLPAISAADLAPFKSHDWPGNVRELRNVAEKLVIGLEVSLGQSGGAGKLAGQGYDRALGNFEKALLRDALLQTGGRKGKAADLLGIPRKRLYLRLKHYGLN